jgi:DnaJ-class molecular chaperone
MARKRDKQQIAPESTCAYCDGHGDVICHVCQGNGALIPDARSICGECNGQGVLLCDACDGQGEIF